jgi:phosphoglycerate dehydrogenase-like enzyme
MKLLCSDEARAELIAAGLLDRPGNTVTLLGVPEASAAEAALVTRDVFGSSTDSQLAPHTTAFFDALALAPALQWVHTYASGLDRPIYRALQDRGITVTNSSGSNAATVAQTALGGFLYFARALHIARAQQQAGTWKPLRHKDIRALNRLDALIVGWGEIGKTLGRYLAALGVQSRVLRLRGAPVAEGWPTATYDAFDVWVADTDWVFFVCPLSDSTRRLFHHGTMARLNRERPLHVVNVSRGAVIDIAALRQAHAAGLVRHAYLDVFDPEPLPPEDPLWKVDDFLISPHIAGTADGNRAAVIERFLQLLARREHT